MPRKHVIRQSEFPYSITARSNNRDWFQTPMPRCWAIFESEIKETAAKYGFVTHVFTLMSNHFHWLVTTPEANIDSGMRYFQTETSRQIARASGRINKIYGSRYKWTLIDNPIYYANTFRYFYQNPLRANICESVDQYPWMTYSRRSRVEITPCLALNTHIPKGSELKTWLNTIPDPHFADCMRKALRRSEFRFPRNPTTKGIVTGREFL